MIFRAPILPSGPRSRSGQGHGFDSRRIPCLALLGLWALLAPSPAAAQFTLLQGEKASLELGGYLRNLTGIYDLGYDTPDSESPLGFNAQVIRLKWTSRFGESAVLEVHDRFQTQLSSEYSTFGASQAGFGVSVVPGRSLDLRSDLIQKDRVQAWHDVDRLSLTLYTGFGDMTVGRQAITWGISNLFPVADLWAQFSPFELDTEEKPGIDAFRLLSYPGSGLELDVVLADRGSAEDLSAGIRGGWILPWADVYAAGGKFWNEILGMAGISAPLGSWKLRGEGTLPYDLDEDSGKLPRVTLGVDRLGGETMFTAEYHFNGVGATGSQGYAQVLQDPRFARGESYYLGRHYLGGMANWTPGNDRLALTLSGMANLQDGSTIWTPVLTYDFGQETRISVGGLLSTGEAPTMAGTPVLRSEYGMYGDLFYTRMSVYF